MFDAVHKLMDLFLVYSISIQT